MIIKRVAVQGFKTYAKKTDFIFDPGITAIVGPNGSGKSNVSDAIRWCLGEQSFSLLRSKKTSDVIFSGSDRKSRLGMAQVSVTLDNSSGELPVDFAEVEITRRAYRDGKNEYLLNGQRVRLQDITEILAPTGLGKRTYALIGQGLIERVLSMAPEDLRSLFEEAAGITTQQAKRTTSMRRLDAAHQNLTRVKDITAEISPRLGYLRRQAERTEQRNEIAELLRGLLEDWYGYHWHLAQRRLQAKRAESEALQNQVAKHRLDLTNLSTQIEEKRDDQSRLRNELGDLHKVSSSHHRDAEHIGRELAVAQERLRQITARAEGDRQELAPLRLQHETLTERIAASEIAAEELQTTLTERKGRVDSLQAAISERQGIRRQLEEDVESRRTQTGEIRTLIVRAQSRHQQLDNRTAELRAEMQSEKAALLTATEQASTLASRVEEYEARLVDIESSIGAARSRLHDTESSIASIRKQLEDALQRRQLADREADRLQTRYDVLSRLRREGAGYANGVQAVLQAFGQDRLSGIRGTVASVLNVPASLDKAIETALGGAYQNVIADTWADAQNAIEYLTKTANGRATFLPLDRLHILPTITAPKQRGVVGNAADLVTYDSDVSDAIRQLLNRVWVVEDLDSAKRALGAVSRGPRPTVVTLRGEIVRPGGAVSGGTDTRRRDNSVLSRERELREIPQRLDQAKVVAEQHADECNTLVTRIESLQQRIPSMQESLESLVRQDRLAREEATDRGKALERAAQSKDWHTARVHQIKHDLGSAADQQEMLHEDIEQASRDLETAEAQLLEAEQSAEASGVGLLLQQLADVRAAAAETQGDLQSQNAILDNQRRNLQSTENQISAKEQRLASLENESGGLVESIERQGQKESAIGAKIATIQGKIGPAEAALARLETEQGKTESEERATQDSLRKDETEWNTAQLSMQRAEDTLHQLGRDIEQEFGLVFLGETDDESSQESLQLETIIQRLPRLETLPEKLDEDVRGMRRRLSRLKNVNLDAPREYAEATERCEFLETQSADLEEAIANLHEVIAKLDTLMESELQETFGAVSEQFVHYFQLLFGGGTAQLSLTDADSVTTSGIEIIARPPGKRPQTLALLSGGERTLAACALIFAILRVSPTPFCVLDEVDAALDEANVDRYRYALEELSQDIQFILITHNRRTLEGTNAIYGVTMGSDGTSRVISLKLEGERIVKGESTSDGAESDSSDDQLTEIEDIVEM